MKTAEKLELSQNIWIVNSLVEYSIVNNNTGVVCRDRNKHTPEFKLLERKLKSAESEIIELNQHLEERVLQRTVELRKENKALDAFSYFVSHDLRAPIRAINSFSKPILHEFGGMMPTKLKDLFGYIVDSAKRMSNIIDDLLNLAKYSKGKLKLAPINLTMLVQSRWNSIIGQAPHHAVLNLSPLPVVQADLSMMEQVIVNLLSNAIKYSAKKARPVITIWAEQTACVVTIYIKDNGAGFDMHNYHRLFGAFQRLHAVKDYEGTGVGLMLVKSIIERHGGTIGAEGTVGQGATFYFTLPG